MSNNTQDQQQQPNTDNTPKQAYNPLMDNVNEKPYTVQSVSVNPEQLSTYIPEPVYQPQAVGGRENPYDRIKEQSGTGGHSGGGSSSAPPPVNPSLKQMGDGDKKQAAKYMATLIMDIYEQGHVWVNKSLPISQRKLQALENEGEIDLSLRIRDGFGNESTAGEYVQEYNNEVGSAFSVDPKWKKETMPILEEVLAKRGAAMTPEQMLLIQFGKDIGIKALQFMQIKKAQKEMLDLLRDIKSQNYGEGGATSYTPPPKTDNKSEKDVTTSPYAYAPQDVVDEDRFNFETNETVMASTVEQMRVPTTGKARAMAQRQKEKKWKKDAEEADSAYEKAMQERKTGKRGRRKTIVDYVKAVNKDEIVDALILSETKNEEQK